MKLLNKSEKLFKITFINNKVSKLKYHASENIKELELSFLNKDLQLYSDCKVIISNLELLIYNVMVNIGLIKVGEKEVTKGYNNNNKSFITVLEKTNWYFLNLDDYKNNIRVSEAIDKYDKYYDYFNIDKLVNEWFNVSEKTVKEVSVSDISDQVNIILNEFEYICDELIMRQQTDGDFNNGKENIFLKRYLNSINYSVKYLLYLRVLIKYRIRYLKTLEYKVLHIDTDINNDLTDEMHKLYSLKDIRVTKYFENIEEQKLCKKVIDIYYILTPFYKDILINTFNISFNIKSVDIKDIIETIKIIGNYNEKKLKVKKLWLFINYLIEEQEFVI